MYMISKSGWKLPVAIHNLKGYDGQLIVEAFKREFVMSDFTEHGEVSLSLSL